jgi:predicted DNA-binding protein
MSQPKQQQQPETANDPTVQMPVKMPKSLRDAAAEKSKQTGVPIAFVVRKAIENWIKEKTDKKK